MKKILTLLSLVQLIAYGQCPIGESEVKVKIHTDMLGSGIYWQLVPVGNNCGTGTIFTGGNTIVGCNGGGAMSMPMGGYANHTTITEGPWCLTQGNSYDIIYVDDMGDGGAEFDVYIDGFPIYTGFSGIGKNPYTRRSFTITPALTYDFAGEHINTHPYHQPGNVDIKATFVNRSTDTINSFDFNYQIDNNPIVTQSISSQTVVPFTDTTCIHSSQWNASVNGSYTLKVWVSNLNGNTDMDLDNDTIIETITVGPTTPNIIDNYIGIIPQKTIIANSSDGILVPRDLDFHPVLTNSELWVILKSDEMIGGKTVKISHAGQVGQTVLVQQDGNPWHFMSLPTGIAFSNNGNFATSPGVLDANHMGGMFTGPTLWSSDPDIYAQPSGGNGSHLDMLHESPYSMGIAAEDENKFWVNDGYHNTIVSYDFQHDHGPGNSNHSDGIIHQYTGLGLQEEATRHVVSHIALDKTTGWLYIADTGKDRIVRLNTTTGTKSGNLTPQEPTEEYAKYTGYTSSVYVNSGLTEPSGIDLIGNRMIVSDHTTGEIIIYNISGTTGVELGRIQTGTPGIMGVKIGPDGKIWYVNATTNEVVRLELIDVTGIEEIEQLSFNLFPNPATNTLNIDFNGNERAIKDVTIYNSLGQIVFNENKLDKNKLQINTSAWSQGIYTVQINNNKQIVNKKLIIN